jgi:hypothetical protein
VLLFSKRPTDEPLSSRLLGLVEVRQQLIARPNKNMESLIVKFLPSGVGHEKLQGEIVRDGRVTRRLIRDQICKYTSSRS